VFKNSIWKVLLWPKPKPNYLRFDYWCTFWGREPHLMVLLVEVWQHYFVHTYIKGILHTLVWTLCVLVVHAGIRGRCYLYLMGCAHKLHAPINIFFWATLFHFMKWMCWWTLFRISFSCSVNTTHYFSVLWLGEKPSARQISGPGIIWFTRLIHHLSTS